MAAPGSSIRAEVSSVGDAAAGTGADLQYVLKLYFAAWAAVHQLPSAYTNQLHYGQQIARCWPSGSGCIWRSTNMMKQKSCKRSICLAALFCHMTWSTMLGYYMTCVSISCKVANPRKRLCVRNNADKAGSLRQQPESLPKKLATYQ